MSAIAYITDSKMLELHRLNAHKTMNFWRLSNNINFSDFRVGDLVFYLSKDKEHMNQKEKGIVGYGVLDSIHLNSVNYMWKNYGIENGYNSLNEFKEAIIKVSKDKKIPKKISSFYLTDVIFFQAPIYLSEFDISISNKTESYIYIKPEEAVIKLLDYAKEYVDIWSSHENSSETIEKEQLEYSLNLAHKKIKDIEFTNNKIKKIYKQLLAIQQQNPNYHFVQDSKTELYSIDKNNIKIMFYIDKDVNKKEIIGQAKLYQYYINKYYPYDVNIRFITNNQDSVLQELLNS